MKMISAMKTILLMQIVVAVLSELPCHAHDENIHRFITKSAFYSSSGLNTFLSDNLYPNPHLITAQPHGYSSSENLPPEKWLEWGAYYEDMEDRIIGGAFDSPRAQDHFYTVTFQPPRIPGQVIGLTDSSEHFLSPWGTNSFAWAAIKGVRPVVDVKPNDQTWSDARSYEFAALTNTTQSLREENLALMLDSLGHVLHLNQDLTSPDHVRNDNHYNIPHRFIENYGQQNYLKNPQWFVLPQNATIGWANWQSKGFTNLLNFWDTGKYAGGSSDALVQEAAGNTKLGLAEWSNGNFLGEDALYNEIIGSDVIHSFPFPSLYSGTTFPSIRSHLAAGTETSFLKDGKPINRIAISKTTSDGIPITHHSVLNYLGASFPRKAAPIAKVAITINDPSVLQDYHDQLIPKAVEYSTGILDYFFRGTMDVSVIGYDTNTLRYTNLIVNTSGQDFSGGTFSIYQDDTNGIRTLIAQTNFLNQTLPDGDSMTMTFPSSTPQSTNLFLVYQGTIGVDSSGNALDPVDTNICIAVEKFMPWIEQTITYNHYATLESFGLQPGATITTNLESYDFEFTPTHGNFEVIINGGNLNDIGSIGGIDAPMHGMTPCGIPGNPSTFYPGTVIPESAVTIIRNRLAVKIVVIDNCAGWIGWSNVSITWRVWPAP